MSSSNKRSSELVDMLSLQLSEFEMISSMFPNDGEIDVDDHLSIIEIQEFINGTREEIPMRLDFVVNLKFDRGKLEVWCSFPHDYPKSEPEVYVRSQELSREHQHSVNDNLMTFMAEKLPPQELCIVSIIQWLQEQADDIFSNMWDVVSVQSSVSSRTDQSDDSYIRLWIYSHHIYNKFKRRSILEMAQHHKLSGFCLPGKPGIICVEGVSQQCDSFWDRIRHMNWKKIILKKREDVICDVGKEPQLYFDGFQEISFTPRYAGGREYHMDMGEFLRYLDAHNCSYVFRDYFGVDGKMVHNS